MTVRAERWRWSLGRRLAAALLAVAAAAVLALVAIVAPATGSALAAFGTETLTEGAETMRLLSRQQTRQSNDVLLDVIRYTGAARERALHDLPLESFGDNVAAMRAAVLRDDAERSARQRKNVEVLAAEMQRRAERDIQRRLADLGEAQAVRRAAFVGAQRATQLALLGGTLLVLLVVLGLGLHRLVVRPTARLRRATQRVAGGELSVDLPAAPDDEIGDLTRDFAAMVGQLRQSREALQRFADRLEDEVRNKTRHLEQALADLKSSHRQLAQAERHAALGTLAGGIAHEFHNLIGGIRGCAGELLADEHDEARKETLGVILRAGERATGIVRQLQRFARHAVGTETVFDPAAVMSDALRLCEPAARRQQVAIEVELASDLAVRGDADGLHQVFVNLLVNALQAMPDGGTLRVAIARGDDLTRIVITVADTGPGIDEAALPHVFEPFFTTRADADDPAQRGSGLGLSVSYGIVTAHGGTIAAQSTAGRGATFRIELPAA